VNLDEIKALDDVKLISSFFWVAVRSTNEVNSRRGLSKKTVLEESRIVDEIARRFNLDVESLKKELDK